MGKSKKRPDTAKLLNHHCPVGRPKHVVTQRCFRKGHVTLCKVHVDSWHSVREGCIRCLNEDKRSAKGGDDKEEDKES